MENYDLFQERMRSSIKISEDKLIKDKVNTFKRALESSYNTEIVFLGNNEFKALISSLTTQSKIERKSFSTLLDNECSIGSIIYWERDKSRWIITEQSNTEKAIFQGYIDKANYQLTWKDLATNKTYKQWACAKGPNETEITDGVKNSIMYDVFSDSLYLIIPKNTLGINLLNRYFEIMVNERKWVIEVVDNITNPNLITLQLKETSIDRDKDTTQLVDGKVESTFVFKSSLDNITELDLNQQITLNPVLYKDGLAQDNAYTIRVTNCINNNGVITFNTTGTAAVSIIYSDFSKMYKYTINIIDGSTALVESSLIIGDSILKTLNTSVYTFVNLINGVNTPLLGDWIVDSQYFTIVNKNSNNLTIKATNKTGITNIKYTFEDQEYIKEIKIIPMFGGS